MAPALVARLHAEVQRALGAGRWSRLASAGGECSPARPRCSPCCWPASVRAMRKLIREARIQPDDGGHGAPPCARTRLRPPPRRGPPPARASWPPSGPGACRDPRGPGLSRRRLLGGAGLAGLLTACAGIGRSQWRPRHAALGVYPAARPRWCATPQARRAASPSSWATGSAGAWACRCSASWSSRGWPQCWKGAARPARSDFTVTNASPARAGDISLQPAAAVAGAGHAGAASSRVSSAVTMDQVGGRIGVAKGSSSQAALGQRLKQSRVVPAASLAEARQISRAANRRVRHQQRHPVQDGRCAAGRPGARRRLGRRTPGHRHPAGARGGAGRDPPLRRRRDGFRACCGRGRAGRAARLQ